MSILQELIEQDYGLEGRNKWYHSADHDSLVYNSEEDYFFWNSRDLRGNALDYLVKVRGMEKSDARKFLKNSIGAFKENPETSPEVVPYDKLIDTFWVNGFEHRNYWYKRCLTDETIDRRNLGYYNEWFTIPLYENGDFVNFQMRRDEPKKTITQWYRRGVALPLYNEGILPFVTDKIYITEGTVDAILLNQLEFPCVSPNGTNTWQQEWFAKFSKIKNIYYIADYDKAGFNGARLVANSLGIYRTKIVMFDDKEEKFDSVDFFREGGTKEEFQEWINTHSYYLFELEHVYGKTKDIGKYRKEFSWAK
jgi:DNA primase